MGWKKILVLTFKPAVQSAWHEDSVSHIDFNLFGKSAEIANQYLKKGSKVLLEGRLVFEQWSAQDGSARSKHSLRVEAMKMLDSKPQDGTQSQTKKEPDIVYEHNIPEIDIDDEIPFAPIGLQYPYILHSC